MSEIYDPVSGVWIESFGSPEEAQQHLQDYLNTGIIYQDPTSGASIQVVPGAGQTLSDVAEAIEEAYGTPKTAPTSLTSFSGPTVIDFGTSAPLPVLTNPVSTVVAPLVSGTPVKTPAQGAINTSFSDIFKGGIFDRGGSQSPFGHSTPNLANLLGITDIMMLILFKDQPEMLMILMMMKQGGFGSISANPSNVPGAINV